MLPRTTSLPTDARRVVILANPRAGATSARGAVDDLVDGLRSRGLRPTVCWHREEFSAVVVGTEPEDLRCVVAAGGDGTLVEALNRAPGRPVALLPLGTENLMARTWGVERSGFQAAEVIAAGRARVLDLGRLWSAQVSSRSGPKDSGLYSMNTPSGRLFTLMAGVGFDAEVVWRTHQRRRGHINLFSYAWPFMKTLRKYRFPWIEVEVVETGERLRGGFVYVFNLPRYGGGLRLCPEARGDDGLLDLLVFERRGLLHLFRYGTSILAGRRHRLRDAHHRLVRRVRLWSEGSVHVQTDGDPAGALPASIEVSPAALTLVVPG